MTSSLSDPCLGAVALLSVSLCQCGGTVSASPETGDAGLDAPRSVTSAAPCPSLFEPIAMVDTGDSGFSPHSLGVTNGVVFYAVHGLDPAVGIWTVPASGGTPERISNMDVDEVWATGDGKTLLAARLGTLYSVLLAGGATTRIGGIDPSTPMAGGYAIDVGNVYLVTGQAPDGTFLAWSMPRAGGPPVQIYGKADAGTQFQAPQPIAADADNLYLLLAPPKVDTPPHLARLPKAGGALTMVPASLGTFPELLAGYAGNVFLSDDPGNRGYANLERVFPDSGTPALVDAVLQPRAAVLDGSSLFVASMTSDGAPAGDLSGGAVWRYDTADGTVGPVACTTQSFDADATALVGAEVVVDATTVYAAFAPAVGIEQWYLMRAPR